MGIEVARVRAWARVHQGCIRILCSVAPLLLLDEKRSLARQCADRTSAAQAAIVGAVEKNRPTVDGPP
jgi:hypothetical protein